MERRIVVVLAGLSVLMMHTACYNTYFISKGEMEKLEAKVEQKESVPIIVDGCDTNAAGGAFVAPGDRLAGMVAEAEAATDGGAAAPASSANPDIDPATGCPLVSVNTASPMFVLTNDGDKLRVTPFNFAVTDSQVVSPDYDLLVPLEAVKGAEVKTFSGWKTGLVISAAVVTAVGLFVGIQAAGGDERSLGQ